ncbi:MAG TPA: hypothetical protein VGG40_01975 [Solirubrobacterales bacterium]
MRRLACLLLLAVAALTGCGSSSSSSSSSSAAETAATSPSPAPPELEAALEEAAASGVPVRVPPVLLSSALPAGANHAEVLRSPPDSYTLALSTKPKCRFKSDCVVAIFSGSAEPNAHFGGDELKLAGGIEGVYEPGRCGPGCKFGTVAWRQDGNTYGVGVPEASTRELEVLANEAIEAEPIAAGK